MFNTFKIKLLVFILVIIPFSVLSSGVPLPSVPELPHTLPAKDIDLQRLNKEYRNAVVMIEFTYISNVVETKLNPKKSEQYRGSDTKGSHGTGFFINENEILTNAHVVEDARRGSIHIKTPATGNLTFKVEVVGLGNSSTIDLAVLKFPKDEQMRFKKRSGLSEIPCLKLGDSNTLKQSDHLAIFGYPTNSDELKVIEAEVTGRQYQHYGPYQFYINHQFIEVGPGGVVQSGNSGGPALDNSGTVVGIPTLGNFFNSQGWLIPISIVREFLDRIRSNQLGKISLEIPELGVDFLRNFPGNLVQAGAPEDIIFFELGVVVREVFPYSIADKWGLKTGDIILGFANKEKGISCALDFEGYRVVTGKMAKWPQDENGISNLNKTKIHIKEMMFTSNVDDAVTLWYLRPKKKDPGDKTNKIRQITNSITIEPQQKITCIDLYEKPEFEYWGDFVTQDFNNYNTEMFDIPFSEILEGGVLVTYVEPNSLASHRGLEISSRYNHGYFMSMGYMGRSGFGKWYIIEAINDEPVKNLQTFKAKLRKAEQEFQQKKQSPEYKQELKNLYKERYAKFRIRTKSMSGEVIRFNITFPIDDALECCSK